MKHTLDEFNKDLQRVPKTMQSALNLFSGTLNSEIFINVLFIFKVVGLNHEEMHEKYQPFNPFHAEFRKIQSILRNLFNSDGSSKGRLAYCVQNAYRR
jgi:hypothetical protein